MRRSEITEIVRQTGDLVVEHYVFPEVAAQLARLLADNATTGRYDGADQPDRLSTVVTADLRSVNGDKHLRLKHHPDGIPDGPDEAGLTLLRQQEAARDMAGVSRVERLAGNVGYLDFPVFYPTELAGAAVCAAMQLVAPTEALIIDLRRCRGGSPDTVALVCSYLFDDRTPLVEFVHRNGDRQQSWTLPYVPGPRFGAAKPVYVLTSRETFSGGEELAYDLQQSGRGTVVGERTAGGAHPRIGIPVHPNLELSVPVARPVHPLTGTNWEGTGVRPDLPCSVADALGTAHRAALARVAEHGAPLAAREARETLGQLG